MSKPLLTPKYLTKEIAEQAIEVAFDVVFESEHLRELLKRYQCHVVVLVPAMEDARNEEYPAWPDYPTTPVRLVEVSYGDITEWEHAYDKVAQCKALQLWTGRNDGQMEVQSHLLFSGDTPYWGGVRRHGIVVTCSGVQPYFDRLISGIVADTIAALGRHAHVNDKEAEGVDFLS